MKAAGGSWGGWGTSPQPVDVNTLVPSSALHLAWSAYSPVLAPVLMPYSGASGDLVWFNATGVAPAGARLATVVTIPATSVAIEVDNISQHADVGATFDLDIELWSTDGMTLISRTTVTPGATASNVTSGPITVTANAEHEVRLTSAGSFLVGAIRLRPLASADSFWTNRFYRVDPLFHLHGNSQVGYDPRQSRYPKQDAYAEAVLTLRGGSLRVAARSDSASYIGANKARFSVMIDDGTTTSVTDLSPVQDAVAYAAMTIQTTREQRVTVRGGMAVGTAYPSTAPQPRQTAIVAIFTSSPPCVEVPQALNIIVVGDSKGTGAGSATPASRSLVPFMRARGFRVGQLGFGGATEAQFLGTAALREDTAFRCVGAHVVIELLGRNDLMTSLVKDPATVIADKSAFADLVHGMGARAMLGGVTHESPTNESSSFGLGGATWDDFRDGILALSSPTKPWLRTPDLSTLWSSQDDQTSDGAHPSEIGQAMMAQAISAELLGSEVYPMTSVLLLSPVFFWEGDAPGTPGTMSSVVSAGTGLVPTIALGGAPLQLLDLSIRVSSAGTLGQSVVQYSPDNDTTWRPNTGILTAAGPVALGGTGVTATMGSGTYGADHVWTSSSRIAQGNDLGSGGHHLVQAVDGARPTFKRHAINTRPGAHFSGGVEYMEVSGLSLATYTIGVVAMSDNTSALRGLVGAPAGKANVVIYYDAINVYASDGSHQLSAACDMSTAHSILVTVNGASSKMWIDGVLVASGTLSVTATAVSVGYDNSTALKHVGDVTAALLVDRVLTTDEIRCVAGRWRQEFATG